MPQFKRLEEEKSFKENKAKIIKGRKLLEEKNKLLLTKKNEYEAIKKILNDLNKAKTEADYKVNITKAELNSLSSLLGHDTSNKETLENSIDSFASLEKSIGSKDLLCYDERRAIEKETDNLCKGIDQEIALIDAEIINSAIKPIGKIDDLD